MPSVFAGYHKSLREDEELVTVFRVNDAWYWQRIAYDRQTPQGMPRGPYPTDEGAYLAAIGD